MKLKTNSIEQLANNLKAFGLNPKDWLIQKLDGVLRTKYIIVSKTQPGLMLLGTPGKSGWKTIDIVSI